MTEALIGLAGIVVGALLGGTGKYWMLRRDAWTEARTSGLLLLADVRALRADSAAARAISETDFGVSSWEAQREVLAGFRRGNFPNGFRAPEWLELAAHFAQLKDLSTGCAAEREADRWRRAQEELGAAERLLARFEDDPPVFGYVVRATITR